MVQAALASNERLVEMVSKLLIAEDLALPISAVTQTFGAIGRKGAGKTYLATMLAEQMLDLDAQVVAIDPVGNWWSLRVDADGKRPGKNIFVMGGEHGDVPLVPEAGAKIARLLVEKRISVVLDISSFRQGERKRFAADFAEEFFHLKKTNRTPVHIFVEEAQLFIPQRFQGDEARMVGAFENIIRLGRNYGIGCTLVTQRPQSVNKEVLSQVECLCVLQVNGVHERKTLEEWVQEAGADRKLVGELPGLKQGEGYVWSPSWLRIFQRVHFAKKTTFDASATPEVGKATKAARLSQMDVESLRADMKEVIAEAEKDDPKALRRIIVGLEKRLRDTVANFESETKPEVVEKVVEVRVVSESELHELNRAMEDCKVAAAHANDTVLRIQDALADMRRVNQSKPGRDNGHRIIPPVQVFQKQYNDYDDPTDIPHKGRWRQTEKLRAGAERMLAALCQWFPEPMSFGQMRSHAGMKKSGTFSTYLSDLRRGGYIVENGDTLSATQAGMAYFGSNIPKAPSTTEEVLAIWNPKLRDGARRILSVLVTGGGLACEREELARLAGMTTSGTFSTYLSDLRTARLIETKAGMVKANQQTLFL